MLWCHGWGSKPLWTTSLIHTIYIQSVLAPWYAVDGHMGPPLHCYTWADRGWILGKLEYSWAPMMLLCHGWGSKPPCTASLIHIIYTQSVLTPWYAVDGAYGSTLTRLHLSRSRAWKFGYGWAWICCNVMVEAVWSLMDCIPHPYHIYIECFSTLTSFGWAYGWTLHFYAWAGWGWFVGKLGCGWSWIML
jgi:hypothetical protein